MRSAWSGTRKRITVIGSDNFKQRGLLDPPSACGSEVADLTGISILTSAFVGRWSTLNRTQFGKDWYLILPTGCGRVRGREPVLQMCRYRLIRFVGKRFLIKRKRLSANDARQIGLRPTAIADRGHTCQSLDVTATRLVWREVAMSSLTRWKKRTANFLSVAVSVATIVGLWSFLEYFNSSAKVDFQLSYHNINYFIPDLFPRSNRR